MSAIEAAERLKEDVSGILDAGRTVAREYGSALVASRKLVLSDLALARTALIRGLVFLVLAALMGGTAWLAAMCILVVGLHAAGLLWLGALLVPLLLSAGTGYYAWTRAERALAFADLDATRRQFADWFPPTQPISTASPTGEANPGPYDPTDNVDNAPSTPT